MWGKTTAREGENNCSGSLCVICNLWAPLAERPARPAEPQPSRRAGERARGPRIMRTRSRMMRISIPESYNDRGIDDELLD